MLRREGSPAYRPGRYVLVLSALIAEAGQKKNHGALQTPPQIQRRRGRPQKKASGSDALRAVM